jgi:uncharacterized phage protein (TIGR02220 family)
MMEAFKKHGHIAYKFYFILHEIYAKYFDYHDQEEFVKISIEKLAKINNINKKNTEKLLKYFREKRKIIYKMEKETILFKISDFKKLHNMWFERKVRGKNTKNVTDIDVDIEIDVEKDNLNEQAKEVLKFFNKATGKNYTDTRYIMPLLKKGKKYEDFCVVIMNKMEDKFFKENPRLITPRTLFKEELFDIYLNEGIEIREKSVTSIER